ncbi:MAG: hypothetical protein RJQ09_14370 [Cyclobacteriaceae bacterium]
MNRVILIITFLILVVSCDCVQEVNVLVLTSDSKFPVVDVKVTAGEPQQDSDFGLTDGQGQYLYHNISGGLFECPDVTLTFQKEGFLNQKMKYESCCITDTVYLSYDLTNNSFEFGDELAEYFSGWLYYQKQTFGEFELSDFRRTTEQNFSDYSAYASPPEEYHEMIRDYLFYSPDSSKVLDIYSQRTIFEQTADGGIEALFSVDSEIFYFDLEEGTRNRILFGGYFYTFDDAAWVSNNEILVVGDIQDSTRQLSVWYANLGTRELKRYAQDVKPKDELINDYLTKVKLANVNLYLDDQ